MLLFPINDHTHMWNIQASINYLPQQEKDVILDRNWMLQALNNTFSLMKYKVAHYSCSPFNRWQISSNMIGVKLWKILITRRQFSSYYWKSESWKYIQCCISAYAIGKGTILIAKQKRKLTNIAHSCPWMYYYLQIIQFCISEYYFHKLPHPYWFFTTLLLIHKIFFRKSVPISFFGEVSLRDSKIIGPHATTWSV